MNSVVPFDAIRIEEMLNYFNLHYSPPKSDSLFEANSHLTGCPWNDENQLLFLQVNSKKLNLDGYAEQAAFAESRVSQVGGEPAAN
jgi:Ca-activated chloride channel family protein